MSELPALKLGYLLEDGFVVVDVVDSYNDLGGAAQRVRAPGRVVVRGGDVENVPGSSEPRRRTPAELDDAYTQREGTLEQTRPSRSR